MILLNKNNGSHDSMLKKLTRGEKSLRRRTISLIYLIKKFVRRSIDRSVAILHPRITLFTVQESELYIGEAEVKRSPPLLIYSSLPPHIQIGANLDLFPKFVLYAYWVIWL